MTVPHVILSEPDKKELEGLPHQSSFRSKVFKRVTALLELEKGKTQEQFLLT